MLMVLVPVYMQVFKLTWLSQNYMSNLCFCVIIYFRQKGHGFIESAHSQFSKYLRNAVSDCQIAQPRGLYAQKAGLFAGFALAS